MDNAFILETAMRQSATDSGCDAADFTGSQSKVVLSRVNSAARRYLELPFLCDFTSYGDNIVASVSAPYAEIARAYIEKYPIEHCFETPNLHVLIEALQPLGANVCFMAEYFLPDVSAPQPPACPYETRLLEPVDFADCYTPAFKNALCAARRQLDCLAVGAYDGARLIGLAGCSADCDTMWQIGVDVLPAYRRQGVASALTAALAAQVMARGIVPFYCCAWSNLKSARNAVKSGFRPAWVQMTVKSDSFIEKMNA